jgi:hypothetical protein
MTVIVTTFLRALERLHNVLAPEENAMKDKGTDLRRVSLSCGKDKIRTYRSIGHKHRISKGACQFWKTKVQQTLLVKDSALENLSHGIRCTVLHQEAGGHKWKRFGAPTITIVDTDHDNVADEESNSHVGLEGQRKRGVEGGNLLKSARPLGSSEVMTYILPIER